MSCSMLVRTGPSTGKPRGFSLVELMIVIAIIGILASIAIPAYQEYLMRARLSEVIGFMKPIKDAVSETVISRTIGSTIQWPVNVEDAGAQNIASLAPYNSKLNGATGITFTNNNSVFIFNLIVNTNAYGLQGTGAFGFSMTGTYNAGDVTWTCNVITTDATMRRYAPSTCR